MIDYYQILGVPRNAPQSLIKKTYAALQKIYHPDVYVGDSSFATQKIQEINEAYKVLSDKKKREAHDKELDESEGSHDDFAYEDPWDQNAEKTYSSMKESEWKYICSFYPEVNTRFQQLKKLSGAVAFQFRMILVETKSFKEFQKISDRLEQEFLTSKFGGSYKLQRLARDAILNGNREFAKDLNKALNVLGQDSFEKVLTKLANDHKKFASEFYSRYNLQYLIKVPAQKEKKTSEKKKPEPKKNYGKRTRSADNSQNLILLAGLAFVFFVFVIMLTPSDENKYPNQTNSQKEVITEQDVADKLYVDIYMNMDEKAVKAIPFYRGLKVAVELNIGPDGWLTDEINFTERSVTDPNYQLFENEIRKAIRATLPFRGFTNVFPDGLIYTVTFSGDF